MIPGALLLIFTGPWLVYLVVPVPDQLAEYRNYSMVAGFALLASLLPWILWTPLLAYCVGMSHSHAMAWKNQITFWKKALKTASGDKSRATQEIGAFLKIAGDNKRAEPYFEDALKLNPCLAPAMENLANIYFMTGRIDKSYEMVDQLVGRCPKYAFGWQTRGIYQERKGNDAEAIRCFEMAMSLHKEMPQSANHLGLIAYRERRFEDALKWFEKAEMWYPDEVTFQYNKHLALAALQRFTEADEIRKRFGNRPTPWNPEMIPPPQQRTA